ncbi:MAG TPA: hypothetical protein DCP51_08360 [Clostridiales bacterium]|nr:hypothetical protein [Clostridiales bacterium]
MRNLTKREKVLLYILSLVIIFSSSMYFLIMPSMQNLDNLRIELDEAKLNKLDMSAKLNNLEYIQDRIIKTKEEINSHSSKFYPYMENNEIENLITDILIEHNMPPRSLSIDDSIKLLDPSLDQSQTIAVYVTKTYVSTSVQGSFEDLKNLIGDIAELDSIRISAFTTEGNMEELITFSIDFEVFTYVDEEE